MLCGDCKKQQMKHTCIVGGGGGGELIARPIIMSLSTVAISRSAVRPQ